MGWMPSGSVAGDTVGPLAVVVAERSVRHAAGHQHHQHGPGHADLGEPPAQRIPLDHRGRAPPPAGRHAGRRPRAQHDRRWFRRRDGRRLGRGGVAGGLHHLAQERHLSAPAGSRAGGRGLGCRRRREQPVQQFPGGGPVLRVLGERVTHQAAHRLGQTGEVRRLGEDPHHGAGRRIGAERGAPGGRVRHHGAPGEDVRGRAEPGLRLRLEPLRRHVRDRPDHVVGAGVVAGRLERPGDAEVDHLDAAQGEQHIAGLEVAVDHARAVDRGERGGDADRHAVQVGRGERTVLADHIGQIGSVDEFDHQVRRVVVGIRVEHLGGAERRHLPGPVHLAAEAAPEAVVAGVLGADHLDRDLAPVAVPPAQVDRAHAAFAEAGDEGVRTRPGGVVRVEWRSHIGVHEAHRRGQIGGHVTAPTRRA
jgi:hypothetical protein